jgi:hypothetical protein
MQNSSSLAKREAKVSPVTNSLLSCAFLSIANTLPMKIPILFHFEGCTWNLQLTNHFTVPLVVIFTKFDGLVMQEYVKLDNNMDRKDRFKEAEDNAKKTFQQVYESSVMSTECPPKVHVVLGGG